MASDDGHDGPHHHATPRTVGRAPTPGAARNPTAPGNDRTPAAPSPPAPLPEAARHRTARRRPSPPSERTPRPRVEVHVNELTGTMSWRTLDDRAARPARASGAAAYDGHGTPGPRHTRTPRPRLSGEAPWSVRAAALRSAGLDPARAPARGAAPIPTHPAAVRAALGVDVASLGPERLGAHLARIGALRSAVAADLTRGARMPTAVASRLRTTTPSHAHTLTAEHTATATRRAATTRTATPHTASMPRTTTAATTRRPAPAVRPAPGPGGPQGR
ncbi:hypothetical protein [Streptomyces neyagawaensis]|uniref:hypothetical protein n=1 Tax=Streptomyces neyagawaensis TaxID=42238 RepID=UPI00201CF136|nr:hypothetical protein [Streptomyces neyagawaensis]MCL6739397.1 hypothetical protein [Streptomyces neyagawaensis]MDE1686116.1 hypothetical protein [Streptomyces neyagawaensis]